MYQAFTSIPRQLISKLDEVFRGDKDFRRSPLRHLLKSNAAPSDSEVIAIRALITDAEASIEELHRRFPTRDHASQAIESRLLITIEAHRALLSPIRYLPSEILQEIFLHYADDRGPNVTIRTMPWRLGHISHRWREIALSLPSLWDNMPKIYLCKPGIERSHVRALIYLLRRSDTSPTLKLNISCEGPGWNYRTAGIIRTIMLHSERIEQLRVDVSDVTMPLLQGIKGRLSNLRILRVLYCLRAPNIDIFETAPALRQVAVKGIHTNGIDKVLLPWSQITHFEEELPGERVGKLVSPASNSLHSLTNLDIYRPQCLYHVSESALLSPYRPTTLPSLRTLRIVIYKCGYKDIDRFLESLTIPAVEIMEICYMMVPLIPHLVSMFSGSRGPSRLQKLAFRTNSLKPGHLSALLKLIPHLVELDIDLPPVVDLLRIIYSEGEVVLVPLLQVLYIRIPRNAQIEHIDTLAEVRCESGIRKDSEDAAMLSLCPGTWTTLHTLRLFFQSGEIRDSQQRILNKWTSSLNSDETNAIEVIRERWNQSINDGSLFEEILSFIECYEITNKILRVGVFFWTPACGIFTLIFFYFLIPQETNLHIKLQHYFNSDLTKLPEEEKLKQRVMKILAKWDQLLLNDFSGGRWAMTLVGWYDYSLVYISKSKFHGECYISVLIVASSNTPFLNKYRIAKVSRCWTEHCIRL